MSHRLEAPGPDEAPNWASLYRARGAEVAQARPLFTGDVFFDVVVEGRVSRTDVIILQHPCAIRRGVSLVSRILVAEVEPHGLLAPSKWAETDFRRMPLPEIAHGKTDNAAANFDKHCVLLSKDVDLSKRIACMSQKGVNLLMQRWVHHNSRAVIPSHDYLEVTAAQFEEADLIEDWCHDRADDAVKGPEALAEIDAWLGALDSGGSTRRDLLKDQQARSGIRRDIRAHLKSVRTA